MLRTISLGMAPLALMLLVASIGLAAETDRAGHLRLIDRLDRPSDGYCIDILGVGRTLRVDVPIFAHNCKRSLTPDSAIVLTETGAIRFPAVDLCVTAAGVNGRALPGAAIILRPCGDAVPFFESGPLQSFEMLDDGSLRLVGSDLCLAVGDVSATTYSSNDSWRVLSVQDCATTPDARVRWEINYGPF